MGDQTKPPGGTLPLPESPELANLKEREMALVNELARLDKMDANKMSREGHDLMEVKRKTGIDLAEIRKAIEELNKK